MPVETIKWVGGPDGHADMIDQTLLPTEYLRVQCQTIEAMWDAIKRLVVRGAPAIGIAAAYGVVLGMQTCPDDDGAEQTSAQLKRACDYLATSRPTAVNLFWALQRMQDVAAKSPWSTAGELKPILLKEALAIHAEDSAMCRAIGRNGAHLIKPGAGVLTHCNAGGLATADYGTALAVMYTAHEDGVPFRVFADETRPLLQGARLTTWELMQAGIDVTLICDSMAAQVMKEGHIHLVVTGADRIAANGDAANKIGTYGVALLAKAHNVPFYIAAPSSTFDFELADGSDIPIEQRDDKEITHAWARQTGPDGVAVYNPAFDVTPRDLIAGIITERGLIERPDTESVRKHFA